MIFYFIHTKYENKNISGGKNMKKKLKDIEHYLSDLRNGEDGMEILQFAIILVATVAMIGVVMVMKDKVNMYVEKSGDLIDDQFGNALTSDTQINP